MAGAELRGTEPGKADVVIGLVLAGLAGVVWVLAGRLPTPPFVPLGPAFFPRLLAAILASLALVLVVRGLRPAKAVPGARRDAPRPARGPLGPALLVFVPLGAYVWLAPRLGFFATTFLYLLVQGALLGERSPRAVARALLVATVTTPLCYVVFTRYLQVLFPEGLLR